WLRSIATRDRRPRCRQSGVRCRVFSRWVYPFVGVPPSFLRRQESSERARRDRTHKPPPSPSTPDHVGRPALTRPLSLDACLRRHDTPWFQPPPLNGCNLSRFHTDARIASPAVFRSHGSLTIREEIREDTRGHMLRFIHAADIHLDSPLRGLEQYDGAPVDEIRAATRRALENLVEMA